MNVLTILSLVGIAAATSMTLKERIAWQEKDSKGKYSQIVSKIILSRFLFRLIHELKTFVIIQLEKWNIWNYHKGPEYL